MTAPAAPDVGEIAAKLTEAQRKALRSMTWTWKTSEYAGFSERTARSLMGSRLVEFRLDWKAWKLTKLGLALRQHLTERSGK